MTPGEFGVWRMIKKGLSANDRNSTREVFDWATSLGRDIGVNEARVLEIFEAVSSGVQPGTPPLD
jgi:hypothetical protein